VDVHAIHFVCEFLDVTYFFTFLSLARMASMSDFLVSLHGTGLLEDGTSGNHHVNTSLGNWTLSREQDLG